MLGIVFIFINHTIINMYIYMYKHMYILINLIKSMRKIGEQNIRKLYKHSNSYAVTLLIALIRELDWQKNKS